jgi:hypothetical protein
MFPLSQSLPLIEGLGPFLLLSCLPLLWLPFAGHLLIWPAVLQVCQFTFGEDKERVLQVPFAGHLLIWHAVLQVCQFTFGEAKEGVLQVPLLVIFSYGMQSFRFAHLRGEVKEGVPEVLLRHFVTHLWNN